MAGNVYEWVSDWYSEDYYQHATGPNASGPEDGTTKVIKGGAWNGLDIAIRSAGRFYAFPYRNDYDGFRCAMDADQTPPSATAPNPTRTPTPISQITQTATGIWSGLQLRTPQPRTTPLPPAEHTPIDGVYAMLDESLPQWWACKRCADYRPGGGIWKLRFDRGIMRIYYDVTGWSSIASYTVSGERLLLFNDPFCPEEVGEYTWKLEDMWGLSDRSLTLETVSDACSIALRGQNLSRQAWLSCLPPNAMTGASGHYHMPPGCEEPRPPEPEPVEQDPNVTATVYAGYTHDFAVEPDIYANANSPENPVPEGITVQHSEESISYGLTRVLWGAGDWIEASTELPFASMGVQILGDHTIGWARVLFDGVEVWRGNTAEIWSHLGRHGGYIEVSGYQKGMHTLRVESLGFDYHPVTVAYFGFSSEGGVRMAQP
jgi:hypothetical protein